jgi:hypothetical protein
VPSAAAGAAPFLAAMVGASNVDAVAVDMLLAFEQDQAESDVMTEKTLEWDKDATSEPEVSDAQPLDVSGKAEVSDAQPPDVSDAPDISGEPNVRTGECVKCKLQKDLSLFASSSQGATNASICKACNTKRSTLSQMFGHWPVDLFKALPSEQQIEFWRSQCKGKVQVQDALVKEVTDQRVEEVKKRTRGEYLPLSVYANMGYDCEKIKENCKDKAEHDILGTTYRVDLKSVTSDDIRKKVWADLFKQARVQKEQENKKDKKKRKRNFSSGSSSSKRSGSSNSSSSGPRVNLIEQRKAAMEARKAEALAKKEQEKAEKAKMAADAKAAKDAEKLATAQAKERTKAKIASQAAYNALFNAHQGLVSAVEKLSTDSAHADAHSNGAGKVEEGESLIEQSLDALKLKIDVPIDQIKAYIQSLKPIISEYQKIGVAQRRQKKG